MQAKGRSFHVRPIRATEGVPIRDRDPFKPARRTPPACGETVVLSMCLVLEFVFQSRLDVAASAPSRGAAGRAVVKGSSLSACGPCPGWNQRESNPQPSGYEPDALPFELLGSARFEAVAERATPIPGRGVPTAAGQEPRGGGRRGGGESDRGANSVEVILREFQRPKDLCASQYHSTSRPDPSEYLRTTLLRARRISADKREWSCSGFDQCPLFAEALRGDGEGGFEFLGED
jgi:hypothetical protein